MKPLSEILAQWRDSMGFSQSDAARQCGLSRQLWFQLESGDTTDPRMSTMFGLRDGTGIPFERLKTAVEMHLKGIPEPVS